MADTVLNTRTQHLSGNSVQHEIADPDTLRVRTRLRYCDRIGVHSSMLAGSSIWCRWDALGEGPRNGCACYHAQNRSGSDMKYCSVCGSKVRVGVPEGDNRERHICDQCSTVHYQNPKVVAGCIAHWEDRVLMCRRAIEPRHGLWTVPAGFMENGETTYQAAMRETLEEANARVAIDDLYVTVNLPHINQVYMLFRGCLLDLEFSPGDESLEVELMGENDIPWEQMAFPTVSEALKLYFADRARGGFPVRMLDIVREAGVPGRYSVRRIN